MAKEKTLKAIVELNKRLTSLERNFGVMEQGVADTINPFIEKVEKMKQIQNKHPLNVVPKKIQDLRDFIDHQFNVISDEISEEISDNLKEILISNNMRIEQIALRMLEGIEKKITALKPKKVRTPKKPVKKTFWQKLRGKK